MNISVSLDMRGLKIKTTMRYQFKKDNNIFWPGDRGIKTLINWEVSCDTVTLKSSRAVYQMIKPRIIMSSSNSAPR